MLSVQCAVLTVQYAVSWPEHLYLPKWAGAGLPWYFLAGLRWGGQGWRDGVEALLTWTQPSYFDLQFQTEKWSTDIDKSLSNWWITYPKKENTN